MLTSIEVSESAIVHNLKQFRKLIGQNRLLMPVVKSNAYGHGMLEVAGICQRSGMADRLCVAGLEEALKLIDIKIKLPIIILSMYEMDEVSVTKAVKFGVEFPLYSIEQAAFLNKIGLRLKKKIKVHLKIDTGTSRVGLLPADIVNFLNKLEKLNYLALEGLWSHFASSETNEKLTARQWKIFEHALIVVEKKWGSVPIKHMACSAAALNFPFTHGNAIRFGLSLYGLYPSKRSLNKVSLVPALTWKTSIIQVKDVPAGTKISYGGTHTFSKSSKIAVLPVGYFDGYDRQLSNKARVIVDGQYCNVIGRVCMNLTMIDVSKLSNVKAGDEVILLGKSGSKRVSAEELGKIAGTINYEIISRINPQIKRFVVK